MLTIFKTQVLERWDALPEALREALASDQNTTIIERICEREHLPEEKITTVSRIAGYVLLGFIHPEEAGKELQEALGVNAQIANAISEALDSRIFAPIRSEIDKVYAPPLGAAGGAPGPMGLTPEAAPLSRTTAPRVEEVTPPAPAAVPLSGTLPPFLAKMREERASPPPKSISEISTPVPATAIKPEGAPTPGPAEPPVFLRKKPELEPVKPRVDFRLEFLKPNLGERKPPGPSPAAPAKLEIGQEKERIPTAGPAKTEAPSTRVVHYSDRRTMLGTPWTRPAAPSPEVGPVPLTELSTRGVPPAPAEPPPEPLKSSPLAPPTRFGTEPLPSAKPSAPILRPEPTQQPQPPRVSEIKPPPPPISPARALSAPTSAPQPPPQPPAPQPARPPEFGPRAPFIAGAPGGAPQIPPPPTPTPPAAPEEKKPSEDIIDISKL